MIERKKNYYNNKHTKKKLKKIYHTHFKGKLKFRNITIHKLKTFISFEYIYIQFEIRVSFNYFN